ncbi:helix-turn-helix domain-containing protein [Enterococcus faecalis]|uniref:AraC family transcriptional regulator n=1 Tax=Enterococcus faecalis TaxID=1351 RepID=UPI0012E2436D|nr:AraC family transcriptional regulator [Enterococcus faecalis]EGO5016472.1 AraC family transcriptional regulator [Enterococcus faecalis]EGO6561343.1 AraC family transcriptional regulator [Enterococcus faecalis]EGO7560944.1 AraC family transcriptional regulator [Enterococcus faecalis]EGO7742716.1 AraC family transcriptional regulator [Enterococcus faecalis]EGO8387401.1 AraC family transcriptional regulator [Enterococcus faecalis]
MNHFIVDGRYRELLKYHGIDVEMVLKKAGLPIDTLNHSTITMKEEEYYRFMRAIDVVSKDLSMPIKLATTAEIEKFSPPIFAAYCSKNGKICIDRLAKYKKLIGPMYFQIKEESDHTSVELLPSAVDIKLPSFLVQIEIIFLINILRKATKEEITPVQVMMIDVPEGDVFANFIGIQPITGSENVIRFTNKDLEEPFISHSDAMWSYFQPELNKRLSELDVDESMSARVRSILTEILAGGMSGIEDVAAKLGLSKRTLQRKLAEENTTFQKQLNSTREVLALHYINHTDITTNDIAYLLGYAELNSFLRAFSIWTGGSVSEYKRKQ